MPLALLLRRPIHVVERQHTKIDALRTEHRNPTLQLTAHRVPHVELDQPPGRAGGAEDPEVADIGQGGLDPAAVGIMLESDPGGKDPIDEAF